MDHLKFACGDRFVGANPKCLPSKRDAEFAPPLPLRRPPAHLIRSAASRASGNWATTLSHSGSQRPAAILRPTHDTLPWPQALSSPFIVGQHCELGVKVVLEDRMRRPGGLRISSLS
jgi:hypothetical protein